MWVGLAASEMLLLGSACPSWLSELELWVSLWVLWLLFQDNHLRRLVYARGGVGWDPPQGRAGVDHSQPSWDPGTQRALGRSPPVVTPGQWAATHHQL